MPGSGRATGSGEPPAKKKRLTGEEKAAKEQEAARKKEERDAKKAEKAEQAALEKQKKEEEKAAKAAEKAQREAEKKQKAEEKEREKKTKAEEKEREKKHKTEEKEREKRQREEEEARKAKSQLKLNSFFKIAPSTPKKDKTALNLDVSDDTSPAKSPSRNPPKETLYERMFQPFFVKDQVTVASMFEVDEHTLDEKSRILDAHLSGDGDAVQVRPFNPMETFKLRLVAPRGRVYPQVREIMSEFNKASHQPIDLTTESQNTQIRRTREALNSVPMKFLGFKEDVRPPYFGTITSLPTGVTDLRRLARKPLTKNILPLNYEYDSEAEWQEEDGEDVDALDDDEDDVDNDEDMGDFLDDSEDAGPARPAFASSIEPDSTGICWENSKRKTPQSQMYKFRMEFILGKSTLHAAPDCLVYSQFSITR
jgi:chromatin assembly factor 1 subunit A